MDFDAAAQLGGIAFDPHLRGIGTVLIGVVVLFGSLYLIIATNIGSRLGFLVAVGGLMGWMAILGLTWWLAPPAIGPSGENPSWVVVNINRGDPVDAAFDELTTLPDSCWSEVSLGCSAPEGTATVAQQVFAQHGDALSAEFPDGDFTLSEAMNLDPTVVEGLDFGADWKLVPSSASGEAVSTADAVLRSPEQAVFAESTDYIVLDSWEQGGKPRRDDDDMLSRIEHKITSALTLRHPPRYTVVQVQEVIHVDPVPGEAPPPPEADPNAPVITVAMVRDLGNARAPGFMVFAGSTLILLAIAYMLHVRDDLSDANRALTND